MELAIQVASVDKADSKAFKSADPFDKMSSVVSVKGKAENKQFAEEEDDVNVLVSFLQHLNQQIDKTNRSSDTAVSSNVSEKKITIQEAILLMQGNVTLKELQQALANLAKSDDAAGIGQDKNGQPVFTVDALLKEIDLVKKNLVAGDATAETDTPLDLTNITGAKSGEAKDNNINLQSQLEGTSAEKEAKFKIQGIENQSVLKTDEKTLQQGKIISQEAQLSESTANKITVNLTAVTEESKISKDIASLESEKEDYAAHNNSRLSTQEIKGSLINKDNLQFAEAQSSNMANANTANKVQTDTIQMIMAEVSGKTKTEQKGANALGEKRNEEISISPVNAASSGSVKTEKNNSISPGEIISQVTNEIKETAANDGGRVKIILNPPSLGKLEMDVTVRNGKVEVVLVADNKDVQQTLNTHIDKLKGSLQSQGLTIERCDVFMQDKREEYQQNFSQQAFYQQDRSGQESNSRQDNLEEKVNANANAIISEWPVNVLRVSTDNISLFA